ncbi:hypothetical protein LI328DRAFT_87922 [Trichoderma asperelloides]|nr:hypothetical protein LI328DRAFT_87922 [Trichoderma asperelloides]
MSTGVNMRTACSKDILANLHFNATTIQQIHGRLNRLGQRYKVQWHNLKIMNSFHDHQERVTLTKWSRQLSAECKLPAWLTGSLREIVIFEMMRSYFTSLTDTPRWLAGINGAIS